MSLNFSIRRVFCAMIVPALTIVHMGIGHAETVSETSTQEAMVTTHADQEHKASFRDRQWHVSIFGDKWVESSLPAFPKNVVTGNIKLKDATFLGAEVAHVLVPKFNISFFGYTLPGNSVELAGQIIKHSGLQDHYESTGSIVIRSGEVHVLDQLSFNVAWANGFSYAFSKPAYEKGSDGQRGINSKKLQYYMGIESEFTHASIPNVHFFVNLHHRSGIYGLISPRKTGSNYIGVGLRWDIQ